MFGTRSPLTCQLRHAKRTLPTFTFEAADYPGLQEHSTVASFKTWLDANAGNIVGSHRVWVGTCGTAPAADSSVVDMGGRTIRGSFTLITNCRIDFNSNTTYQGSADARVDLIALNASANPPAIDIKNNFTIPDPSPAVLLYATGQILVKNNAESNGAVYAGAISIKNGLDITYDPRVERTVGFGDVRYQRIRWQECRSGILGATC